ncbi:uncharacterized protein [Apostichopus japonicus]|uniref:uncharacterized protein n=1 Tax=Stichopus japonicus TaxID=307972 RepID=UPI003AB1A334
MSDCRGLRVEGNKLYYKGLESGISLLIVKERLRGALKYYYKAKSVAINSDDLSSTMKNIGKASLQMAKATSKELSRTSKLTDAEIMKLEVEVKFYSKESLSNLFLALRYGTGFKHKAWLDAMESDIGQIFTDIVICVRNFGNFDMRISSMFVLCGVIEWEELRAALYMQLATDLSEKATQSLAIQDFRGSLRMIHEMNYPLEEASKVTGNEEVQTDIRVMKQHAVAQLATAESMQSIFVAKKQLDSILNDMTKPNMNMVYDTLDMFKDAAIKTREIDLEQEAKACYYQGYIFEKLINLKHKAKKFYMQVLKLVEASDNKLLKSERWYKACLASIKAWQDADNEQDEEAKEERRKKFKDKMEKELNNLSAAKTTGGVTEFLKHIYSKHSPKNKPVKFDFKLVEGWSEKTRKTRKRLLMDTMRDYHPDKNSTEQYGEDWHFLVEEISKILNDFHDIIKAER